MVKVIKILIVDDNIENIETMMILLKSKYYNVVSAGDGQKALKKLHAEKFDLIISDILMPVMDGFQLCRKCKEDPELVNICFIFYTATYIDEKDEEFALSLGAQKFLRKPQEPEVFLKLLKEVIEKTGKKNIAQKKYDKQDEKEVLKLYNERLVAKLEKKNLDLENEIASHKETGSKLKESEERYRTMIDNSRDLIQSVAPDGHILFVNPTWRKVLGYSQKEIAHLNLFDIIHPDSIPHCRPLFEKIMSGKNVPHIEVTFITKDGRLILLEGSATPRLLNGKVIATQSFFHDVTKRKQMEEALRESEKNYRELIDGMNETVWVIDFQGNLIDVNNTAVKVLGYSKKELLGIGLYGIDSSLKRENIIALAKAMPTDELQIFETSHRTKNGRTFPVEVYSSLITYQGKQAILSIARDITERKQAEEKLVESETKFRQLVAQSPDGIFIIDFSGTFLSVNKTMCDNLKYTEEELLSMKIWDIVPPRYLSLHKERIAAIMKGEINEAAEYEVIGKNGVVHYIEVHSAPYYKDKEIIGFQGIARNITEKKIAEKALRESEEKYRNIFENVQDVYYETLLDGTIIEVSPSVEIISGGQYHRKDVLGKSMNKFYPDTKARDMLMAKIKEKGSVTDFEVRLRNRDGSFIWCSISSKIQFDDHGTPLKIIGSMRNIDKRKLAEETVVKERTLLRTLIDNLPNGVFVKDKEYRKIIVNPVHIKEVKGHLKYLGIDAEINILGKTDFEVFPKELAEKFVGDDLKVVCDGAVIVNNEGIGYDENGEQQWLLVSKMPFRDINGEIIGMVGVTTDITERRHAEEALKTSEEKFRTIFDNANDGMFLLDTETRKFLMCNAACSKMLGYSDEEFLNLDVAAIHPSETLPFIFEQIENIFKGVEGVRGDIKFRRKDGTVFTADLSPTLVTIDEKRLVLIVFRDITERLLIETELRSAKEKAEESDKLKTAFLHNISHEIRTPLNGIIGFSDMIANPDLTHEKREQFAKIIRNSSDELLSIINDIISMATIEAGHEKPREKEFNMNQVLQLINKQNLFKTQSKNLSLTVSSALTDDEAIVLADETKILQILTNLVNNAIKFTPEGSIKVTCKIDGNVVKFAVKDTGIGIPPEMHEKIFDRFFQLDHGDTRLYGGTGLGLSIVKSYVHLLNGKIQLNSKPGKGSEFIISIPYKPVKQLEPVDKTVVSDYTRIGPATILIAEDEIINFELLEEFLSDLNLTIIHAANGIQAVEACKKNPSISLVLMDVKMPQMDGYEAARRIKEFRPQLPIIIQSAYIFQNEREKSMSTYIDGFLEKPINQNKLLATIQKNLKKSVNL